MEFDSNRILTTLDHDYVYNTALTHTRMLAMGIITVDYFVKIAALLGIDVKVIKVE